MLKLPSFVADVSTSRDRRFVIDASARSRTLQADGRSHDGDRCLLVKEMGDCACSFPGLRVGLDDP